MFSITDNERLRDAYALLTPNNAGIKKNQSALRFPVTWIAVDTANPTEIHSAA